MFGSKEILTAIGSLGCAIGIGFVMQSSEAAEAHYGKKSHMIPAADIPELKGASAANAVLDVQEITLTSAEFDEVAPTVFEPEQPAEVIKVAATESDVPQVSQPETAPVKPACDISASARPIAAAMVDLSLNAPCLPNERITVHHNGMIFSETTSDVGAVNIKVPALTHEPVFIMAFPNGEGAVAQTKVEELADFDRVVLQWKGNTGFQIHAREFGADYGTKGHIWEGAPGTIAGTVAGKGGVLTRHGDIDTPEPLLAEVYTFPKVIDGQTGQVTLTVEAEVTDANCGLEVEAQSLEIQPGGSVKTQNVTLPVPDCDAKGNFLVLNNLLQDLKVAGK